MPPNASPQPTMREPIAIIGMACRFPMAPDLSTFWSNILKSVDCVSDPVDGWDAKRYLDSGRVDTAKGGFLKELFSFDPKRFGVMPSSVDGGEPDQYLALQIAKDALDDAGYGEGYDHEETGIILGHSTYLHRGQGSLVQHGLVLDQTMDLLAGLIPELEPVRLEEIRKLLESKLPQFNADVAPSLVPNVMTGRIANRLDLRGPNYLIDAACSSSLLAVGAAVDELRNQRSRMMIAGGVNASLPAEVSVIFSFLGALSGRGRVRPFEEGSDGTLLGEGLGAVVLKRRCDALKDGDRIYALVREVGQASDGKGHGLLAPSVDGEALAMRRAYTASGVDPKTVSLIEAHGTGIPLGDQTEISALRRVFGDRQGEFGSIALGSVKSMISHCIPAAGIAGLIKTSLALHERILPPTLCDAVNPELQMSETPFYVNTRKRPWVAEQNSPRRAGVNAFGFGGINTHAILEEAPATSMAPPLRSPWEAELTLFAAESPEAMSALLQATRERLGMVENPCLGAWSRLLNQEADADPRAACRLAVVARSPEDLLAKLGKAEKRLAKKADSYWVIRSGIVYSNGQLQGQLAFLFPGEGSQYPEMFADLAEKFSEVRHWFDFWHSLYDEPRGSRRTDCFFQPPGEAVGEADHEGPTNLHAMDVGSEAVFVGNRGMFELLNRFGIRADALVGHSSGESCALAVAGAVGDGGEGDLADFIRGLNTTYRTVAREGKIETGCLLVIGALPREQIELEVQRSAGGLHLAMDNCENQVIVFGRDESEVEALEKRLAEAGGIMMRLPFDRAYHTACFEPVAQAFLEHYERAGLGVPDLPIYSCATATRFPNSSEDVRRRAAAQWSSTVRFRDTIERMYEDGIRFFVEVGPSSNLSAFVGDILSGRPFCSVSTSGRNRGELEHLLLALGQLYVHRKGFEISRLHDERAPEASLDGVADPLFGELRLDNTMPMMRLDTSDRAWLREVVVQNGPLGLSGHLNSSVEAVSHGFQDVGDDSWSVEAGGLPLLSAVESVDGSRLVAVCDLDLEGDRFLQHHVLSGPVSVDAAEMGLSCVPLAVSLEIMAEAAAALAGSRSVRVIQNVEALGWLDMEEGSLQLEAEASLVDGPRRLYRVELRSQGVASVVAEFSFETDWGLQGLGKFSGLQPAQWHGEALYSTGMFHGPLFQSIASVRGWCAQGIDAELSPVSLTGFFDVGETPSLILNPVLLDALGQLSAYWIAHQMGTNFNSFPSSIERIELYCDCPENIAGLQLRGGAQWPSESASRDPLDAAVSWAFECTDQSDQSLFRVSNYRNVCFRVPSRYVDMRRSPLEGSCGGPLSCFAQESASIWSVEHFERSFLAQSGGMFGKVLAHAVLDEVELEQWTALPEGRQREWLSGRIAIKEAVRDWVEARSGERLYPREIEVDRTEKGAPFVTGWWVDDLCEAPNVSLSHDRDQALVALCGPESHVGIDAEAIGRVQKPEHLLSSLTQREQDQVARAEVSDVEGVLLRIWCAKEAAAKSFGTGLQGEPLKFEVQWGDSTSDRVDVLYGTEKLEVVLEHFEGRILALALKPV
ncbi:MAG: beta-ketoacyl synthase N-terminal-like domain-containing protein [Myxococcota bacterium]|nr:beta-ketoacyl synthase N-terminal-like domain-containing protein [Myxococcota bacterium]